MSKDKAKILIERGLKYTSVATFGKWYINGKYFCFTLEDIVRAFGIKVKKHTAIPEGTYKGKLTYSNRFKRTMLSIYTEKDGYTSKMGGIIFKGVRAHGGNTIADTDSCILVAKKLVKWEKIYDSMEKELYNELIKYDNDFEIEIINKPQSE